MLSKKLIALAVLLAGVSFGAFAQADKKEEAKPAEHVEAKEAKSDEHHDEADAKSHEENKSTKHVEGKKEEHHDAKASVNHTDATPKKTCKRKSSSHKSGDEITARLNKGAKLEATTAPMHSSVN
jgi:hypothetical protein